MLAGIVLAALLLAAGIGGKFGRRGAITLAVVSLLWFVVNGPVEGPTLIVVTRAHGLTLADLAGLAGLALAAYRWFGLRGRDPATPARDGTA